MLRQLGHETFINGFRVSTVALPTIPRNGMRATLADYQWETCVFLSDESNTDPAMWPKAKRDNPFGDGSAMLATVGHDLTCHRLMSVAPGDVRGMWRALPTDDELRVAVRRIIADGESAAFNA